jgi:MFS family permease
VVLLAAVLFINYVDRGTLPTAAHLIQADLHLNEDQLGLLFSAFFWTYSLVQIPVGWLAERYGAHRVLALGLAVWALATICVGAAHTFPTLLGLRLLLGIGESVGFPCVSKLLAAVVPIKSLGTANGVVAFAYLLGPAVGTYLGGLLMASYGWRAAFIVFGCLSLLWLLPWSRVTLPARAVRRSDADKPNLRTLLKQPSLWGTVLGLFSSNYTFYFMLSWLPFYLVRERGFSTIEMAKLASMAYLVNAASAVISGWVTDKLIANGRSTNVVYKTIMALTHAGSVLCMLCMALGSRHLALGAIFVYQVLCGVQAPGVYAIPQILAGPRATGRWVGIQNSLGNFAGIIAPAATGFIVSSTHHFTAAFLLAAAVGMLGLIGWLWMLPKLAELQWDAEALDLRAAPFGSVSVADD